MSCLHVHLFMNRITSVIANTRFNNKPPSLRNRHKITATLAPRLTHNPCLVLLSRSRPPSMSSSRLCVVVTGPTGAGKSTLLKRLFAEFPSKFAFTVSHTTRNPREGEVTGREYHFTTKESMQTMVDAGEFIEWTQFSGNMYGTSKMAINDIMSRDQVCVLDVDLNGVKSMKAIEEYKPLFIFVTPPSTEVLKQRLIERGTETEETMAARLASVEESFAFAKTFDFDLTVVNDKVDDAYKQLKDFLVQALPSISSD
eukprot:m.55853 g.55853  ORF g.55853 m.55853 type:complete len:256 (-) comp11527_c0_seq1:255-1022(-)